MAVLSLNTFLNAETTALKEDLNDGVHTFLFPVGNTYITVENGEAVPLTINMLGDGVTTFQCAGYGTVDVSSGVDVVIAAGTTVVVNLKSYAQYLGANNNNVTVTTTGSTTAALAYVWLGKY